MQKALVKAGATCSEAKSTTAGRVRWRTKLLINYVLDAIAYSLLGITAFADGI